MTHENGSKAAVTNTFGCPRPSSHLMGKLKGAAMVARAVSTSVE